MKSQSLSVQLRNIWLDFRISGEPWRILEMGIIELSLRTSGFWLSWSMQLPTQRQKKGAPEAAVWQEWARLFP